jgi:hypothetical protein
VELEEGTRCSPPVYGPAAGACWRRTARGLVPELTDLPEFKHEKFVTAAFS